MVGGLQSNKIKDALSIFSCIHSVDRIKILEHINKYLNEDSLLEEFFIQVNISNEASKGGVDLQSLESFLKEAKTFSDIKIIYQSSQSIKSSLFCLSLKCNMFFSYRNKICFEY